MAQLITLALYASDSPSNAPPRYPAKKFVQAAFLLTYDGISVSLAHTPSFGFVSDNSQALYPTIVVVLVNHHPSFTSVVSIESGRLMMPRDISLG